MSTPIRCAAVLAAALTAFPLATVAASADPTASNSTTVVPLKNTLRSCDFSGTNSTVVAARADASVSSVIRAAGSTVTAEVHLSDPSSPGSHYDVRLIQAPRVSQSPCGPGAPGVAVGSLDSDGAGQATTTVQDSIRSGTTGAWVFVQRPSQFSQDPAEFYTSDFVATV
jgi:hypothetical protein